MPWPTYGADNARLRAVATPGVRPPFRRVWTFHGRHLLEFPPVLGHGSVFEEAFDGASTRSIRRAAGCAGREIGPSESSPLVAGGIVYVGDQDGRVNAFSSRTGRLRWSYDTGAPIKASASLAYGNVYVGNYAGAMLALSARTGRPMWRSAATAASTRPLRSQRAASASHGPTELTPWP